jgi:hypothetical protein
MLSVSAVIGIMIVAYVVVRFCFAPKGVNPLRASGSSGAPAPGVWDPLAPNDSSIGSPQKIPIVSGISWQNPAKQSKRLATSVLLRDGSDGRSDSDDDDPHALPASPALKVTRGSEDAAV